LQRSTSTKCSAGCPKLYLRYLSLAPEHCYKFIQYGCNKQYSLSTWGEITPSATPGVCHSL
jgi:hypothetical protein